MKSKFAERLRLYRGNRSQAEIAEQLDLSAPFYSDIERGKKKPSYETLLKIIEHTGLDANYWFGLESSKDVSGNEALGTSVDSNLKAIAQRAGAFEDLKFSEILSIISQLYVYLDTRPEPLLPAERRMLSDILAACQRLMDSHERPSPKTEKAIKAIND